MENDVLVLLLLKSTIPHAQQHNLLLKNHHPARATAQ
jgi:hypothetical protein